MICAIEGNIGVGKSHLLDLIMGYGLAYVVEEPLDGVKDLLVNYYKDPHTWAFPFQLTMLAKRAHTHLSLNKCATTDAVVERTIYSDKHIFAELIRQKGYIDEYRYADYINIYNDLTSMIKAPDIYIYLRAPVETLIKRIISRNREGEKDIDVEYLKSVNNLYDNWLLNKENCHIIDVTENLSDAGLLARFSHLTNLW